MKKIVSFTVIMAFVTIFLNAEIGWSGNIWPNSESMQIAGQNITVYYQIWKDGVTPGTGQGENITATLYYKLSTQTQFTSEEMIYHGDVGNNDEYSVDIPSEFFNENDIVNFYCEGFDVSDTTYSYGTDQNNAGPFTAENPGIYYIGSPTSQDVTVTFQVNMVMVANVSDVSVAGDFNNWTAGQNMLTDPDTDNIYTGDVVIPAGSNPFQHYKFVNGTQWEDQIENRSFVVDDSSPTQVLDAVYFNNQDPADYLTQEVTVTFNLDVSDSVNAGTVFNAIGINGNTAPLDWDFGAMNNPLTNAGNNIWTVDIIFPEGSYRYLEFKFAHDGYDWEAGFGENHLVTINDASASMTVNCVYGQMGQINKADDETIQKPDFALNNYPNPFRNSTTVSFNLSRKDAKNANIEIYNIKGQKVKQLRIKNYELGINKINWDGKDESGKQVQSGIYFYKLKSDRFASARKMILMKW